MVQISWQPQSSKELLQFVNMVCKEVYDKDLQRRPNTERRGQEAVKGRLDSMGVGTKLEGCLREEYPHYRTLYGDVVHNTRNSKRYDLLASFGDFQVSIQGQLSAVLSCEQLLVLLVCRHLAKKEEFLCSTCNSCDVAGIG